MHALYKNRTKRLREQRPKMAMMLRMMMMMMNTDVHGPYLNSLICDLSIVDSAANKT
jgi:hypothetical protein